MDCFVAHAPRNDVRIHFTVAGVASFSLASHSLFAAASSCAAAEGSVILRLTKYPPLVLATSGEEAR